MGKADYILEGGDSRVLSRDSNKVACQRSGRGRVESLKYRGEGAGGKQM